MRHRIIIIIMIGPLRYSIDYYNVVAAVVIPNRVPFTTTWAAGRKVNTVERQFAFCPNAAPYERVPCARFGWSFWCVHKLWSRVPEGKRMRCIVSIAPHPHANALRASESDENNKFKTNDCVSGFLSFTNTHRPRARHRIQPTIILWMNNVMNKWQPTQLFHSARQFVLFSNVIVWKFNCFFNRILHSMLRKMIHSSSMCWDSTSITLCDCKSIGGTCGNYSSPCSMLRIKSLTLQS